MLFKNLELRALIIFFLNTGTPLVTFSQINGYAKVTNIAGEVLTLSSLNQTFDSLKAGTRILVMQMQGATISNTTNSSNFGSVASVGATGLYELATIDSINSAGTSATLTSALSESFDPAGSLQVITYPTLGTTSYTTVPPPPPFPALAFPAFSPEPVTYTPSPLRPAWLLPAAVRKIVSLSAAGQGGDASTSNINRVFMGGGGGGGKENNGSGNANSSGTPRASNGTGNNGSGLTMGWGNSALPTEMSLISAVEIDNRTVEISWKTYTETNCDYFEVEHTQNGSDWIRLQRIQGQGTSKKMHSYSYFHENAPSGDNYYRISQCDYDRSYNQSKICYVKLLPPAGEGIYPNPCTSEISIDSDSRKIQQVRIYSSSGKNIAVNYHANENGKLTVDVSNLEEGVYYLHADERLLSFVVVR